MERHAEVYHKLMLNLGYDEYGKMVLIIRNISLTEF